MKVVATMLMTLAVGSPSAAQTTRGPAPRPRYVIDIPSRPLKDALAEFTKQTAVFVSFFPDNPCDPGPLSRAVKGKHTAESAITRMLKSSGLQARRTNDRSMVIMSASAFRASTSPQSRRRQTLQRESGQCFEFHLPRQTLLERIDAFSRQMSIQIGASFPEERSKRIMIEPLEGSYTTASALNHSIDHAPGMHWEWQDDHTILVSWDRDRHIVGVASADVVVTGRRVGWPHIDQAATPIIEFNEKDFQQLGVTTVGDLLEYTPQQPYRRADFYFGEDYAELRGLGWDTTLVLVDGKRTVVSSVTRNAVDLNNIPLAIVDRIEVLSDSGSVRYGADAMGGIVNILLKKDVRRPTLGLEYGTARGGGAARRASFDIAHSTERSRTTVAVEAYTRDLLLGAERSFWADQDYRRYGGQDYRSVASNPGTVSSLTGAHLPGLTSAYAAVPAGSTGIGLTSADFTATAGQRNYSSPSRDYTIVPEHDRLTALLSSDIALTDDLTGFAQLLYTQSSKISQNEPLALYGAMVPTTNPFNPFGQPVMVDYVVSGTGPEIGRTEASRGRVAIGVRRDKQPWSWELSAVASDEQSNVAVRRTSVERALTALAQSDPARALNPFADGAGASDDVLASLMETTHGRQRSQGHQISGTLQGSVMELPAGSLRTVLGAEWREESVFYETDAAPVDQRTDRGREVLGAFAEFNLPLTGTVGATGTSMSVAARVDRYSSTTTEIHPHLGLMWRPYSGLLLRASYGTNSRPASLFELYTPRESIPNIRVLDARRANELSSVTLIVGGNPKLDPVLARSSTFGVLWRPSEANAYILATYWDHRVENRVSVLPFFTLLANEPLYTDRILRESPTMEDVTLGRPGRLVSLDSSRINVGRIDTSGIDIQTQYNLDTKIGRFTPHLAASWTRRFEVMDIPGTEPVNTVGRARNVYGTIPRWRVVGRLAWERSGVEFTTTGTWIPAYDDATPFGGTAPRKLPSRTTVDVQASIDLDAITMSKVHDGLRLSVGAKNATNKMPDNADVGAIFGYDITQSDLLGRWYYAQLSKEF